MCLQAVLVHTRELCVVGLLSSVLHAHACLHACEMKMCHVEPMLHTSSVKFKLTCTIVWIHVQVFLVLTCLLLVLFLAIFITGLNLRIYIHMYVAVTNI